MVSQANKNLKNNFNDIESVQNLGKYIYFMFFNFIADFIILY